MPVRVLIGNPGLCVVSMVAHYVLAFVTDTVVANLVHVSCKIDYVYAVTAGNSVPVSAFVT